LEGSGKPGCLILNAEHQLLFCACGVNVLDGTVCTAGSKQRNFLVVIKVIGLETNYDKTQYMVKSGDLKEGQSYNIKTDNSSFVKMDWFKS
jgi:hypothetical protein